MLCWGEEKEDGGVEGNDEPRISAETTNFYAYVLKILIWSLSFLFQLLPWVETPFVRYLIP